MKLTVATVAALIVAHTEALCRDAVLHFLATSITVGCLTFQLPDGKSVTLGNAQLQGTLYSTELQQCSLSNFVFLLLLCFSLLAGTSEEVVVKVFSLNFFVRIALEYSLGLGRSYIAGEWEVQGTGRYSDGLTRFLTILLLNRVNSSEG